MTSPVKLTAAQKDVLERLRDGRPLKPRNRLVTLRALRRRGLVNSALIGGLGPFYSLNAAGRALLQETEDEHE